MEIQNREARYRSGVTVQTVGFTAMASDRVTQRESSRQHPVILSSDSQKHTNVSKAKNIGQVLTDSLEELFDINSIFCTCFNHHSTYGFSIVLSILQGNFPGKEVTPRQK